MEQPPLSLRLLRLSPPACISTMIPPSPLTPVPLEPVEIPPPPSNFSLSPSPHYAGPFGTMSLGETISTHVILANTSKEPVQGVKMMIEVQGPNGRYRLGELAHDGVKEGDPEPDLEVGGEVGLEVGSEMKDVGLNVLICSVAWETPGGRKTFQRFLKFNVTPPLAVKTRIHTPSSASIIFDPTKRSDIHLEVLVQNTSMTGLAFDKVLLEPVKGLISRSISSDQKAPGSKDKDETLFPDDTKQYLFTLSPDPSHQTTLQEGLPMSSFPPTYTPGAILPLGRLDVAWFSAPYREAGRLQTSTLNRRVPPAVASLRPQLPSRMTSTLPPTPGSSVVPPKPIKMDDHDSEGPEWEYDLVALQCDREVAIEQQFTIMVRLAARRRSRTPGPRLGLQYLTKPPSSNAKTTTATIQPGFTLSPPSRSSTPISSNRPFSPGTATSSRPMTPVSTQLRQATSSSMGQSTSMLPLPTSRQESRVDFPPPPLLPSARTSNGSITHLGTSLSILPLKELGKVAVNHGTTYDETEMTEVDERWEVVHEHAMRFIALDEGMCELGGLRVLLLDDEVGSGGSVAREWESLGEVWVTA